jgi:hypothetical protein
MFGENFCRTVVRVSVFCAGVGLSTRTSSLFAKTPGVRALLHLPQKGDQQDVCGVLALQK